MDIINGCVILFLEESKRGEASLPLTTSPSLIEGRGTEGVRSNKTEREGEHKGKGYLIRINLDKGGNDESASLVYRYL